MLTLGGAITNGASAALSVPSGVCTIPTKWESSFIPAASVDVLGVLSNDALFTGSGAVSNKSTAGIGSSV
jgi:hypothetical protein